MAAQEAKKKVIPPTSIAMMPTWLSPRIGASLMIRKTPALTMVEECRSAEVGVGATIAPRSHPEKGIIADFVNPQKTRSAAISSTGSRLRPRFTKRDNSTV